MRKMERESRKRNNEKRKRGRRKRLRNIREAEERYGKTAVGACGRKIRYNSESAALHAARTCKAKYGGSLVPYRCPYCGQWHLTTDASGHGARRRMLRPSEVLQRSRAAAIRIRAIETEKGDLWDRIGVQGYSLGVHGKNSILDPSRKIDDWMDSCGELDEEISECQKDVDDAWRLVPGIREHSEWGEEAAQLVVEYFIYGKSLAEMVESTTYTRSVNERAVMAIQREADELGTGRLLHARGAAARGGE